MNADVWNVWNAWLLENNPAERGDSISLWDVDTNIGSKPSNDESGYFSFDGVHVSTEYLYRSVQFLRHHLVAAGVVLQDRVCVLLPREGYGASIAATYLCCNAVGLVFIALEASLPLQRLQRIIALSKPQIIITCRPLNALAQQILGDELCPVLIVDALWSSMVASQRSEISCIEPCDHLLRTDHISYIIFTSGSTGQPKGVLIRHGGVLHYVSHQRDTFQWTRNARVIQFLPLCFDASLSEMNVSLISGALLVFPPSSLENAPGSSHFVRYLEGHQVSSLCFPPAFLGALGAEWTTNPISSLQSLIVGGELTPRRQIEIWSKRIRLINVYGPTEATVCSSTIAYDAKSDTNSILSAAIGSCVPQTHFYLANDDGAVPGPCSEGELLIGGAAVAAGYLEQPAHTAEKFIPDIHASSGGRAYATGDWVRCHSGHTWEYVGRIDTQVKVRGLRVELAEIDRIVLDSFESVRDSVSVRIRSEEIAAFLGSPLMLCLRADSK